MLKLLTEAFCLRQTARQYRCCRVCNYRFRRNLHSHMADQGCQVADATINSTIPLSGEKKHKQKTISRSTRRRITWVVSFLHLSVPPKMLNELVLAWHWFISTTRRSMSRPLVPLQSSQSVEVAKYIWRTNYKFSQGNF